MSPELDALDGMIRLQLHERKAPDYVLKAWDGFLDAGAKWEAELSQAEKAAKK